MARSRRKTPILGNATARSEAWDKAHANRRLRHRVRQALVQGTPVPLLREVSNVWGFSKDGKRYCPEARTRPRLLRK